jgi:TolB protein
MGMALANLDGLLVRRSAAQDAAAATPPQPVRITRDGLFKQRPMWSPDGKALTFARHRGATIFVYVCAADGSQERRLTQRTDPEYDAAWSPDGKRLAFSFVKTAPNQGDVEVYTIDADGQNLQPLATSPGKLTHEEWPAWSPDGKWVAFSSTRDGNQELYLARPDGSELRRLTSDGAIDSHPAWSPDGKSIAFATGRYGDMELALLDVAELKVQRLTASQGLDDYPAWSPDGTRIAFTSNRDGNLEIFMVAADGQGARNVSQHPGLDNFPTFAPDGRLTWVSNRGGRFDIYAMPMPGDRQ